MVEKANADATAISAAASAAAPPSSKSEPVPTPAPELRAPVPVRDEIPASAQARAKDGAAKTAPAKPPRARRRGRQRELENPPTDDQPTDDQPTDDPPTRSKRGGPSLLVVLGTAWAAVWIVLVAANDFLQPDSEPPPNVPAETRGPVEVGGITSVQETFDGLAMDSALPAPWTVSGGGAARIVALPTSVDRSVRIASGAGGVATAACRPTRVAAGTEIRVALEYRVGRPAPEPFPLLTLQAGDVPAVALTIDAGGSPIAVVGGADGGASDGPVRSPGPRATAATDWHRVELTIVRASGAATWRAYDASGAETRSGAAALTGLPSAGLDRLCLRSPEGLPSGWIAIDDLRIEG
jgi:hypothetical protein